MKNLVKVLGIIAVCAVIGLAVSCSVDPDEQTRITITDIPEGYEGKYAAVMVVESLAVTSANDVKYLGAAKVGKVIRGGVAEAIPLFELDMKNEAFGDAAKVKKGYILLFITEDENYLESDDLYSGKTIGEEALGEGTIEKKASIFTPDITKNAPKPKANDYGTYSTTYKYSTDKNVTETIELSEKKFKVYDDYAGTTDPDYLEFQIDKWDSADVPEGYTDYTGAYKFTGKILKQKGYVPSTYTAPGIAATDVKEDGSGPDFSMYIYFKGETSNITFIRTAFTKVGADENKAIVVDNATDKAPRIYRK